MSKIFQDIIASYDDLKEEVEPLLFVARDKRLQEEAAGLVMQFVDRADGERLAAILDRDDRTANDLLALAAIAKSLAAELHMYVLLKEGESEKAWDRLIDAQHYTLAASRASKALSNLEAKFNYLRELERWLFPPQSFMSAGLVAGAQHCSICNDSYDKCAHISGRAYAGRFCNIVLKDLHLDHAALVEAPYDRRCRVVSFSVPSGKRNKMTWVVTPTSDDKAGNTCILLATTGAGTD